MYETKVVHVFATYLPRVTRVSFHNKFRKYFEVNVLMIHHHKTIQLVVGQSTWNLPFLKTGFLRKLKNYDASVICTVIDCISYHLCAIIFSNLQNKNHFLCFDSAFQSVFRWDVLVDFKFYERNKIYFEMLFTIFLFWYM